MLAATGGQDIPKGDRWAYEPKWDGFRALIFRADDRVIVQGRSGDDLGYAFPEIVNAALRDLPPRIVLDGELVIINDGTLDFPAMGARIRPRSEAGGRAITEMAAQSPATFVAFDVLAIGDTSLLGESYTRRRAALEALGLASDRLRTCPMTRDHDLATRWFHEFEGGGLDGVIVKDLAGRYTPGKRTLRKAKHERTLEAVVAGWRGKSQNPDEVASLLLGLYDGDVLHHVGVVSGFSAARRRELSVELAPLALPPGATHPWLGDHPVGQRRPGTTHRWSRSRSQEWIPIAPVLVAEVAFDQFEGDRLRHVARWLRWRPDRQPESCTVEQIPQPPTLDIDGLWP